MYRMKFFIFFLLGFLVFFEAGAQIADKEKVEQLRAKAGDNNPDACYELAKLAEENRLSKDPNVNAAEYQFYLDKAVKLGHPKAMYELASGYLTGKNLMNQQLAYPYLQKLAKMPPSKSFTREDLIETYYWMGHCLEYGKGVRIDSIRANRFYLLASIGSMNARFTILRQMMKSKKPAPVFDLIYEIYMSDPERATPQIEAFLAQTKLRDAMASYLERKSSAGDIQATILLAENFMTGGFFPMQRAKAIKFYQRAASQGSGKAALYLANLHEHGLFNLDENPETVKKYLRLAFVDPDCREEAALRLARLTEKQLAELNEKKANKPASASRQDANEQKGDVTAEKIAAAGSINEKADKREQLKEYLFYYLLVARDYKNARAFVDSDPALAFHAKDLILKAKEYRMNMTSNGRPLSPKHEEAYMTRMRMACNAGYPLAVLEYWPHLKRKQIRDYALRLHALLAFPWPEDPVWNLMVSDAYVAANPQRNSMYSPEKAVEYLKKAAELRNVEALDRLIKMYSEGSEKYNVKKDPAQVAKYTDLILKYDIRLERPEYFNAYLRELQTKPDKKKEDILPLFRSIGLNPIADYASALFSFEGSSVFGIEKDPKHAMLMLHLSARGENLAKAVQEIIRRFQAGAKPNRTPDEVLLDQEMIECYKSLL